MWPIKKDKKATVDNLNGVMRDVDSYISELSQESANHTPTRAQSLQQPQRASPHATHRSNTTHRHYKINETPQSTLSSPIFTTENGHQPLSSSGVRPALGAATFVEPGLSNHHHSDYVNTYLNKQQEVTSTPRPTIITTKEFDPSSTSDTSTPITSFPPDLALLSALSKAFLRRIRGLENVRDLFCANEYPESFTGQEAIKMLRDLLDGVPVHYCIKLANILMKATPPLFEPIHYSQKSIIQGALFNSPDEYYTLQEDMSDEDVPTGILTGLLPCYSYMCLPGKPGCYAYACPNKPGNFTTASEARTASRPSSTEHMLSSGAEGWVAAKHQIAWAQRVPKVLLRSLSKKEVARQEAINEMIYSEEIYKNDLDTLSQVIVTPLLTKSTIISSRKKREQFVREVFGNYTELNEVSSAMYKDLLDLQHENDYVPMVGDTLIKHFAYFEDPFSQYCPRVSLAEYLVKSEERNNPDFERFIVQVEKSKRMRRLPFRHFLLNPVTRMQRYPLLISAILKKTDKEHPDHAYLVKCLDMVKKVAFQCDALAELFKKRVEILRINDMITFKQGEFQDLQLTDPQRRLYYQGDIKRRSNGIEVTEKSDIHIFVFDHLLLMTKLRKSASVTDVYRVWRRPIPLQMLYIGTANDTTIHATSTTRNLLSNSTTGYLHGSSFSYSGFVPLTLHHLGQRGGVYTFSCLPEEKQKWIVAIDEAKTALKKRLGENVYDVITLDDTSFRSVALPNTTVKQGKVNCTVPFVTIHDEHKIAVGTDTGVYFKSIDRVGIRKVLSCENVTQLAILEEYHILLVLADKTLKAYPLDRLDCPTAAKGKSPERLGQELGQHVHFFQVGFCNGKDLVIFKKKKNTMSIFTCLEPIYDLRDPKNEKYITQKTGFLMTSRSSHAWFKKYKEFYVGAEATNIHFLKSKLLIVCERGFEIIDPENLGVGGRDIPDKGDPQFNFVHRQADALKPLAMYRVHDKFLLCYNKFSFYVNNRNGSLVQRGPQKLPLLCEWEGNPENIVFQYPYVIAFDPQFIEVHHVDTGNLVQIIPGDQIRLTHFQTNGDKTVIQGCMTHSQRPEIQNIFYLKLNHLRNNARKFI
ncbi:CNH domain-containing protein [Mucor mucedo]|uniref:CNH domain-containing protein n=1 Tax=Mucor mucedo TaxID=29922 RepID=UPI0022205ED6|nr:CNH domain-containing protein [Mucor mucedo]KAI7887930.1 CNH domain-containing protein [Mucor mucedo]